MAVKGWRRSWEMRATILFNSKNGSSIARSDRLLHNDSAGNDRRPHTVRSSIQTLPSAMGQIRASASPCTAFGEPLKKTNYRYDPSQYPCVITKISYIRNRGLAVQTSATLTPLKKRRHSFDSATYRSGARPVRNFSFLLQMSSYQASLLIVGYQDCCPATREPSSAP